MESRFTSCGYWYKAVVSVSCNFTLTNTKIISTKPCLKQDYELYSKQTLYKKLGLDEKFGMITCT